MDGAFGDGAGPGVERKAGNMAENGPFHVNMPRAAVCGLWCDVGSAIDHGTQQSCKARSSMVT